MLYPDIFGAVAGIISLIANSVYVISIPRGRTKPNRATWLVWTIVGAAILASYYSSGARSTIWVPVIYFILPFIVVLLSIKYGTGGWSSPFDRKCLAGAFVGLILWWIFNSPLVALTINIFIDFMGALPTIRKVYYDPRSESLSAWSMAFVGYIFNLMAINKFSFAIMVYPIYTFLCCGSITWLMIRRRIKLNPGKI